MSTVLNFSIFHPVFLRIIQSQKKSELQVQLQESQPDITTENQARS